MSESNEIKRNVLVPEHIKLSENEKKVILDKHGIEFIALPKISIKDPAIQHLNAKDGDVIKIVRMSSTAGKSVFFRGVINE
ncbi:MAG: DNA-directed RNA polymerase subunit H [Candidatus Woesearchaeota archaeon]